MLRIHIHPGDAQKRSGQGASKRAEPTGASTPRTAHAVNCGYRLEAAARRVGLSSRYGRDLDRS